MKKRWLIPVIFAAVCFVLAGVSVVLTKKGHVGKIEKRLDAGQTVVAKNLELKKGRLHTLHIVPAAGVGLNETYDVSATLTQGDSVIFEVADSYWHERGVWREGGESGTWEEQNSLTQFEFRVPETGNYELEISLDATNTSIGLPFRAAVTWKEPWFLSMWPLLLGGFFLLGVGGFTAMRGGSTFAKALMKVGRGSRLEFGGEVYEVIERSEHWERNERVGVDLRTRSASGIEVWLSISGWWRESPFDEENGQTLWQIFMGVPLTDNEKTLLDNAEPGGMAVTIRGRRMHVDRENSGGGSLVTERAGDVYIAPYYNWAYRTQGSIPTQPGEMWLECAVWRTAEGNEWWLSKLMDWKTIDIVEEKPARMITFDEISRARQNPDPLRVRTQDNQDPFGVRGGAAANTGASLDFEPPRPGQRLQKPFAPPSSDQESAPQQEQQVWKNPKNNDWE